jgi:hypothetical protein
MARTSISVTSIDDAGTNLTDATFTTLSTGDGNGVQFNFNPDAILVLKNDTGGPAAFTIKVPTPSGYRVTIPDETVSVADGKTYLYRLNATFKQSDGKVYVDCDVAGKVLLVE